jgi:hypothetical protein
VLGRLTDRRPVPRFLPESDEDPIDGDDFHLALYACYELHYRSFSGVSDDREWDPDLLRLRGVLERHFEARLRDEVGWSIVEPAAIANQIQDLVDNAQGPSLSQYMLERGGQRELREFAVHRSAYQLKEADPHTWAIPRISGAPKAALVSIQHDEYGSGDPAEVHAELFAGTMRALGLDPTYGAYLDAIPGSTLATCNLVSMLGLHRRHRGALIGHLAVFEMTSVVPMGRYAAAARRLGLPDDACRFYEAHVAADAEHQIIARDMAAALGSAEPKLVEDILFGCRSVLFVERRFAEHLLRCWACDESSLRRCSSWPTGRVGAVAGSVTAG